MQDQTKAASSNWSLYIDESGDFEREEAWVVSGVLVPLNKDEADKKLKIALEQLLENEAVKIPSQLHATEIRMHLGNTYVTALCSRLLDKVTSTFEEVRFVAVVNRSKRSLHQRERSYRMMLLDLLALAETILPPGTTISSLEVVIATRGKDGELWTSETDIQTEVLDRLRDALEVDLASRGLVNTLDKRRLKMHLLRAAQSRGLTIADFIANFVFNETRDESGKLVEKLIKQSRLVVFESQGGLEERRARIAERDGDHVTALCRWARVKETQPEVRTIAMSRSVQALLRNRGTAGPIYSFEAYLEHIHRDPLLDEKSRRSSLSDVEKILEGIQETGEYDPSISAILFRIRNRRLFLANRALDSKETEAILCLQKQTAGELGFDPEHFGKLMQFKLLYIDTLIRKLQFDTAYCEAKFFLEQTKRIGEAWCLLIADQPETAFLRSHISIAAQTKWVETTLLAYPLAANEMELDSAMAVAHNQLTECTKQQDRERLRCHILATALRRGRYEEAQEVSNILLNERDIHSVHSVFWAARTAADMYIACQKASSRGTPYENFIYEITSLLRKTPELYSNSRDPIIRSHLRREQAVLEWAMGNQSDAKRWIKESVGLLELGGGDSPINIWFHGLAVMHRNLMISSNFEADNLLLWDSLSSEDQAKAKFESATSEDISPYEICRQLDREARSHYGDISHLLALRRISPR